MSTCRTIPVGRRLSQLLLCATVLTCPLTAWAEYPGASIGAAATPPGTLPLTAAQRFDPSDTNWATIGSIDGSVKALTVWDNKLVAGGAFSLVDGTPAASVAAFDGALWTSLGSGLNGPSYALVAFRDNLIVGGSFTTAGGIAVANIAAWDGVGWAPLGMGIHGMVRALTVYRDTLIAAGSFDSAGAIAANHIAAWDGANWTALGTGTDGAIAALTVHGDSLIAGGYFTAAGGMAANRIAAWRGGTWAPLGSGMDFAVFALVDYRTRLIAGGAFTTAGGLPASQIASWDGYTWSPLGSGVNSSVYALEYYGNQMVAGGLFGLAGGEQTNFVAAWLDQVGWARLGFGADATVWALKVYGDDLIVGGDFDTVGGLFYAPHIASWSGLCFPGTHDNDADRACSDVDACPAKYDPLQQDSDLDGIGDLCDVPHALYFYLFSPVDMVVTDSRGDSIGIGFNTIGRGSTYDVMVDENSPDLSGPDDFPDDRVIIPNPKAGPYAVRMIRQVGAPDTARFTLAVRADGNQLFVPDDYFDTTLAALDVSIPDVYVYGVAITLPGDANADGHFTAADIIHLVGYVFKGGLPPVVAGHGDANCDEATTSADIIYLVNHVFKSGLSPCSQTEG